MNLCPSFSEVKSWSFLVFRFQISDEHIAHHIARGLGITRRHASKSLTIACSCIGIKSQIEMVRTNLIAGAAALPGTESTLPKAQAVFRLIRPIQRLMIDQSALLSFLLPPFLFAYCIMFVLS